MSESIAEAMPLDRNLAQGGKLTLTLTENTSPRYRAEVCREILSSERRHTELGLEGLARILKNEDAIAAVEQSVAYWHPRVAASFGTSVSQRFEHLQCFALRHPPNEKPQARCGGNTKLPNCSRH